MTPARDYVGELAEIRSSARGVDRRSKHAAAGIALAAAQDYLEGRVPSEYAVPVLRGAAGILNEPDIPGWAVIGTSCEHNDAYKCAECMRAWAAEFSPRGPKYAPD